MPELVDDVRDLARLLVDDQEAVAVSGTQSPAGRRDRGSVLELRVAPDDLGKVIAHAARDPG